MSRNTGSNRTADVIVIGGGLIGCSVALKCAQAGLKVIVVDRGEPGAEASSAAAGMIAPTAEMLEPDEFFKLCVASRDLYPQYVAEIEQLSGYTVGFRRDGTFLVAITAEQGVELERLFYIQTGVGVAVEKLTPQEVRARPPGLSPDIRAGLFLPGDHWVDNERLMRVVVEAGKRLGVLFHAGRAATKLHVRNGRVESMEAGSTFSASQFVLAAGCWSAELVAPLGIRLPMHPCRGQMLEFESSVELPFVVRAGLHYLVPREGKRFLAGTTAEYVGFQKVVTGEGLRSILEGVMRLAAFVRDSRFRRAWAGLRPDTADHLPILGYGELKNLIFATGHYRHGILLAPVTTQVISELLLTGSCSHSIAAYQPARFAP